MNKIITGFKGFDKNFKCCEFQFAPNTEYTHDGKVKICSSGFHFCENPLDIFAYYTPADSRFARVEGSGDIDKKIGANEDTKIACKKLRVGVEITLNHILSSGVKFILDKVDWNSSKGNATNTGDGSAATNTGGRSAATNTGDRSAATNTGYGSAATNTGYGSAATNTGDGSAATNTGYRSVATNTGAYSAATVAGQNSLAIVTGYKSKAKGKIGCWIVLTERADNYTILDVEAFKVDGKKIKEDTFYILEKGKPVVVN